jgi:hypothetical protein
VWEGEEEDVVMKWEEVMRGTILEPAKLLVVRAFRR